MGFALPSGFRTAEALCVFCALLAAGSTARAGAQAGSRPEARRHAAFLSPRVLQPGELSFFASLTQAQPPEYIIEESALLRLPLLTASSRIGLSGPLLGEISISTNVATLHVAAGPRVAFERDRLSVSAGFSVAFWYGRLDLSGFDSQLQGWIHYPSLSLGWRFDGFTISTEAQLILSTSLSARLGDLRIERATDTFSGVTIAVHVEQPLWKDQIVSLGVRAYWTKLYYPSWAAFPAYERHFWIPELTVGFVL